MTRTARLCLTMALLLVAALAAAILIGETGFSGAQYRQALFDPAQQSPRELELQREVEDLRERIHVLERIATDGRKPQALADEIERLRDK